LEERTPHVQCANCRRVLIVAIPFPALIVTICLIAARDFSPHIC